MSDAEIHDELLTLLVAGHETTATALSWAVERLIRHPDKLARLRDEVEAGEDAYLDRDDPGDAAAAAGDRRSSSRRLTEAIELGGYDLPAGVHGGARASTSIHRDPTIYPEPDALPARALPRRRRPAPTPGSPSAAACAAASAPPSPSRRWRSCCAELVARRTIRPDRSRRRAHLPPRDHRDPAAQRRGRPQPSFEL